jgi:hypothetical protein
VILKGQWIVSAGSPRRFFGYDLNWDHAVCPKDIRRPAESEPTKVEEYREGKLVEERLLPGEEI